MNKKYRMTAMLLGGLTVNTSAVAEVEPYYLLVGADFARVRYLGKTWDDAFRWGSESGVTQMGIDVASYYPVGGKDGAASKSLVGLAINFTIDSYSGSYFSSMSEYTNYALSGIHFVGKEPGDGFFLRGDVGMARYLNVETNDTIWGTGFLFGLGYGSPMSKDSRLLIGANYSVRDLGLRSIDTILIGVSGLW